MKEKQYCVCVCQGGEEELCFEWCNLTETGQMSLKISLIFFTQCSAESRLCGINKTMKQPPSAHIRAHQSPSCFPRHVLGSSFLPSSFTPTEPTHTSLTRPQLHITHLVSFQMRTCIFALWREIFFFQMLCCVWERVGTYAFQAVGGGWKANVNRDFAMLLCTGLKISWELNGTPRRNVKLFQSVLSRWRNLCLHSTHGYYK